MKKLFLNCLFVLMSVFAFVSCSDDDTNINIYPMYPYGYTYGYVWQPNQTNSYGQFVIGGYVNGQQTRAALQTGAGATYEDFALYAWTADSVVMNGFHGVFAGNTWGYAEDLKYFDNFVPEYNFIGIIPQTATQSYSNGVVTVEANAFPVENVDPNGYTDTEEVLYATNTVAKANYATGANLAFHHANTKVYVQFKSNDPNTQIIDYSPYTPANPGSPAVPAVPGTETYTSKSTKFIDELVAGNEVQVGIGFVGASSPKLTKTNPTTLYVGSNNATYNYYAKDWLLSIKDAVNSQFVYYRLNAVANSTSKTVTTEDWESAASNKNIFMMKLADGVNATDFANGNDAFATALKAHQTDWVGGSTPESFWAMFEQAYAEGWRVIRINVSDANAGQVLVFLSNNQNITTQVCEITGGTPAQPAVPATPESGVQGFIMLPATSAIGDASDAVLSTFPSQVNLKVGLTGNTWETLATANRMGFTKPAGAISTTPVASPTTWFAFPAEANDVANVGYTLKFSFVYQGVNVYDARVYLPAAECAWEPGKYYTYIIEINGRGNGKADPTDVDGADPTVTTTTNNEIKVNVSVVDYVSGQTYTHVIH